MGRFTDKVAIVTGSSSGIGQAVAVLFAREGAKVTITGRNEKGLEETRNEMLKVGAGEENINSVAADIITSNGQDSLIETTLAKFGKIDILVNNAGAAFVDPSGKEGTEASIETFHKTIQLNTTSVLEMIQKCREHLIKSKGEIVNISSIAASKLVQITWPYYAMAKAALDQLTRSLAIELAEHGVRVNGINPGMVITNFIGAMGASKQMSDKAYAYLAQHRDCIPIGKIGAPEDIANIVAFLADRSQSFYILGQMIVADGGTSLVLAMLSHDISRVMSSSK